MATRWGIVSVGKICHDFVSVLRSLPKGEHQVVAAAARNLERAKKFNNIHEIPKAYGSYEALAKDKNVEIAYVGVLNRQHFEVGKLMLENGKHLLLEKPMGMNIKQTQEIISIAKKNNLFLMEGLWSRFFPAYRQLADEISRKSIGDIVHVNVTHGMSLGNEQDRIRQKSLGGGGILDIGVYAANALCFIYGEAPLQIKALGELNPDGVDQCLVSSLLYSKGRTATATVSTTSELANELEVIGTKGKIKISTPYHCPTEMITPEKTFDFPLPRTVLPCNYNNSSGLRYEATAVRECLKKGLKECPLLTHRDSEMNARIMDQWRKEIGVVFPEDSE